MPWVQAVCRLKWMHQSVKIFFLAWGTLRIQQYNNGAFNTIHRWHNNHDSTLNAATPEVECIENVLLYNRNGVFSMENQIISYVDVWDRIQAFLHIKVSSKDTDLSVISLFLSHFPLQATARISKCLMGYVLQYSTLNPPDSLERLLGLWGKSFLGS